MVEVSRLFIIISLLVLLPSVLAASGSNVEVYDEWHNSGDTWFIEDDLYTITVHPSQDTIRLEVNDTLHVIDYEDCGYDLFYKYCFHNLSYDADKSNIDVSGDTIPGIQIQIFTHEPEIEIHRTMTPADPEFGDTVIVDVILENKGDKDAENVYYIDRIPEKITIIGGKKTVEVGRKISWTGLILAGQNKTFNYELKASNYVDESFKANLSYVYEGRDVSVQSSAMKFEVPTPYKVTAKLSDEKPAVEEVFTLQYIIENKDIEDTLNVDVHIVIPSELLVLTTSELLEQVGHNDYIFSGELKPEQTRDLPITLQSFYTGEYNISAKANYNINDKNFFEEHDLIANVETPQISPKITSNKYNLRAGESFVLNAYLTNTDEDNSYYDIDAVVESEFFTDQIKLDSISVIEEYKFEKEYYPPLYDNEKKITVNLSGTYKSLSGETFSFYTKREIKVGPVNQSFEVDQVYSDTTLEKGNNLSVAVHIKNLKDDSVYGVSMHDEVPGGLDLIQGKVRASVDLVGEESKQAYAYLLSIPRDFSDDHIDIVTYVSYEKGVQVYTRELTSTITLTNPPDMSEQNVTINETEEDVPTNTTETVTEETTEEKGWWGNLVDGIKSFFSDFFS